MTRNKIVFSTVTLLALFCGYSIPARALSVSFTTVSTTADKGFYALAFSDTSSAETEILRTSYFLGNFLDAADLQNEQSYVLADRDPVNLQGLGELFNGTFFVTKVTHRVSDSESGFETVFLVERDQFPLVDNTGNTNISLLFSSIRLETRASTPGNTEISGVIFSPVPIPAAIWLFGTGLVGLIGFSKRRKMA